MAYQNKPKVLRLKVNLSWKDWLKPFFIHQSVTDGAANNMAVVQDQPADEKLTQELSKLLDEISRQLVGSKYATEISKIMSLQSDTSLSANQKLNGVQWVVGSFDSSTLKDELLDQLKQLMEKPAALAAYVNPGKILQGSFLKTYGFDGYESTSTELVDAEGEGYSYDQRGPGLYSFPSVPFSLALMTFLGFPTRLHDGNAHLGPREIVRNLFGGWDSLKKNPRLTGWFWWLYPKNYTFQGKRLWNVIFLPIKFVIFAVKVATIPLKFALNVLKFFTEFLPEVILNYSGYWFGLASSAFLRLHYEKDPWYSKILLGVLIALVFTVAAPIHYAARLLALVGTALTSPEKSARSAWNYGRAINSRWGYVFAFIGAALSIALSATLWAIALPFVFAEALVLIPALGPIVAGIAQWPIVASSLAVINGAATLVAGTVPATFSLAATALSSAFGVAVSATTLAVATTVAFIVAPVASIASRLSDGLSNVWAKWKANRPLFISNRPLWQEITVLQSVMMPANRTSNPSSQVEEMTSDCKQLLVKAGSAGEAADSRFEAKPDLAQTPEKPSPAIDSAGVGSRLEL